ncbi:hypothetical protein NMY22_g7096 [Coprinellus aureogranulatus]|nr:hypothetical protein NMY22_g7096 [Coprinellus aureogranulatus]
MDDAVSLESFGSDGMQQPGETQALLHEGRDEGEPFSGVSDESWWRKQSPWWALVGGPLLTATIGLVMAPKIEVYTALACMKHRPELFESLRHTAILTATSTSLPAICSTDPEIRTVVAKLSAGEHRGAAGGTCALKLT